MNRFYQSQLEFLNSFHSHFLKSALNHWVLRIWVQLEAFNASHFLTAKKSNVAFPKPLKQGWPDNSYAAHFTVFICKVVFSHEVLGEAEFAIGYSMVQSPTKSLYREMQSIHSKMLLFPLGPGQYNHSGLKIVLELNCLENHLSEQHCPGGKYNISESFWMFHLGNRILRLLLISKFNNLT